MEETTTTPAPAPPAPREVPGFPTSFGWGGSGLRRTIEGELMPRFAAETARLLDGIPTSAGNLAPRLTNALRDAMLASGINWNEVILADLASAFAEGHDAPAPAAAEPQTNPS